MTSKRTVFRSARLPRVRLNSPTCRRPPRLEVRLHSKTCRWSPKRVLLITAVPFGTVSFGFRRIGSAAAGTRAFFCCLCCSPLCCRHFCNGACGGAYARSLEGAVAEVAPAADSGAQRCSPRPLPRLPYMAHRRSPRSKALRPEPTRVWGWAPDLPTKAARAAGRGWGHDVSPNLPHMHEHGQQDIAQTQAYLPSFSSFCLHDAARRGPPPGPLESHAILPIRLRGLLLLEPHLRPGDHCRRDRLPPKAPRGGPVDQKPGVVLGHSTRQFHCVGMSFPEIGLESPRGPTAVPLDKLDILSDVVERGRPSDPKAM
jgi:hypothetical protein